MPPDRKQISVWINTESAVLLSSIAKEQGVSLARIIELAVAAYSTSDRTSGKTSDYTSEQTSGQLVDSGLRDTVEELRGLIASQDVRLCALEVAVMTGLNEGGGKLSVRIGAAENGAVESNNDAHSRPADSLPTAPEFNQDKDQFRAEVVKLYRQGIIGSPDILRILYDRGFRNSKGNNYYRNDVRQALKDAGLE
jgi:hypothetical protein